MTNILNPGIHVREQAVEFEKEDVTVILEWGELNPLHSINVSITPETQVNISSSIARLTMAYNVTYNVSVVVSHLCERNSVTIFSEAYYYLHIIIITTSEYNLLSQRVINFIYF